MRCTQCRHEFCFACGAVWHTDHYGCARPEHPDNTDGAEGGAEVDAQRRQLLEWCVGGYSTWEGKRVAFSKDFWLKIASPFTAASLQPCATHSDAPITLESVALSSVAETAQASTSTTEAAGHEQMKGCIVDSAESLRYWVDLSRGLTFLNQAQDDFVFGCLIMARSFAIDLAIPGGFKYIRARRLLRILRASLEVDLQPLAQLCIPARQSSRDLSMPLAVLYILETEESLAHEVTRLGRRVKKQANKLVGAGRAGVLLAPSSKSGTAIFLASEALANSKAKALQIFSGVRRLLGV